MMILQQRYFIALLTLAVSNYPIPLCRAFTATNLKPLERFTTFTTQSNVILSATADESSDGKNEEGDDEQKKNEEAELLRSKAEKLREQIRAMEESMPKSARLTNNDEYIKISEDNQDTDIMKGKSLKNKRVLVVGANGRLGSMVTRNLLRSHPEVKEVVAAVHYVGEATTRGYGRLSYEVGAEDGVGTIGAAWAPEEERNARFEFSDEMKDYNLQNLVRFLN